MAALEQDPELFPVLYETLMTHQGKVGEDTVYSIAETVGYDGDALREAAAAPEIEENIKQNYLLGSQLDITGTPGFVIGDRIIRGYVAADELAAAVEEARGEATN
jgi:protein-disulfide isomerase